jgi:hypothetical protein
MTDLLISAAKDRTWADLDCFVRSVNETGFKGRKVMFVENVPELTAACLVEFGWEVIAVTADPKIHFQTWRYYPIIEFLRSAQGQFRYVFFSDACDVVWQSDPTIWLEQIAPRYGFSKGIVAAQEGWKIKDQEINDVWIKRLVPHHEYQRIREEEVLCSGTIQGTAAEVLSLFESMSGFFGDEMQGIDQGIYNVVLRHSSFRIPVLIAVNCLVTTLGIFLAPSDGSKWTIAPPALDWETGQVWSSFSRELFPIVHQYNRRYGALDPGGAWREVLERRYRS